MPDEGKPKKQERPRYALPGIPMHIGRDAQEKIYAQAVDGESKSTLLSYRYRKSYVGFAHNNYTVVLTPHTLLRLTIYFSGEMAYLESIKDTPVGSHIQKLGVMKGEFAAGRPA